MADDLLRSGIKVRDRSTCAASKLFKRVRSSPNCRRDMRVLVLGRKSWFFAGSDRGGAQAGSFRYRGAPSSRNPRAESSRYRRAPSSESARGLALVPAVRVSALEQLQALLWKRRRLRRTCGRRAMTKIKPDHLARDAKAAVSQTGNALGRNDPCPCEVDPHLECHRTPA